MDNTQNIFKACENRNLEIVKFLVEQGADLEAKNVNGNTPLIVAFFSRSLEIVKFLVEKGADLEAKDINGFTPLIWASFNGYIEIVKFLIEKGADTEAKDNFGNTFYIYIRTDSNKEIDLLLKDIEKRKMMIKSCKRYPFEV